MALPQEVWVQDIVETLFDGQPHIQRSVDHSEFVGNNVVHVPNESGVPGVEKSRASIPATVQEISEKDLTYNLDAFTTDPIYIRAADELEVSYNKRASQTRRMRMELNSRIGLEASHDWATDTSSRKFTTSGSSGSFAQAPGATGTRKAITLTELQKVARLFRNDKIPQRDWYAMFPASLYYQLFDIDQLKDQAFIGQNTLPEGIIPGVFGFNFIIKADAEMPVYDSSQNLKSIGSASATGDNLAVICWQQDSVSRALGDINVYERENDPTFYGHILSAELFYGGRVIRDDEAGTAAIVQTS